MVSNFEKMMVIVARIGVARNAPRSPQNIDQKRSAMIRKNELRLSFSPIIFGSMIFPEINCGILRTRSIKNERGTLQNVTNEYKKGRPSAIIPPTTGTKSKINTIKPNIKAKSSPKQSIIIVAITPLNTAMKNFETK